MSNTPQSNVEKCAKAHDDARDGCSKILAAILETQAKRASLETQIAANSKQAATDRAEALVGGGSAPKQRTDGKLAVELEETAATLSALAERHAEACRKAQTTLLALRLAEADAAAADERQHGSSAARLERELEQARGELADARLRRSEASAAANAVETESREEIGVLVGSPDEIAAEAESPAICIDRARLCEILTRWRNGWLATPEFAVAGEPAPQIVAKTTRGAIYYCKESGEILREEIVLAERVGGGACPRLKHVSGYRHSVKATRREIQEYRAGLAGRPFAIPTLATL
jgi:hypothetical protein